MAPVPSTDKEAIYWAHKEYQLTQLHKSKDSDYISPNQAIDFTSAHWKETNCNKSNASRDD